MGWLRRLLSRGRRCTASSGAPTSPEGDTAAPDHAGGLEPRGVPCQLDEIVAGLKQGVASAADVTIRPLSLRSLGAKMVLVFVDGLVDKARLEENVILALRRRYGQRSEGAQRQTKRPSPQEIIEQALNVGEAKVAASMRDAEEAILSGEAVLFFDGSAQAIRLNVRGWERRAVEEPKTERVIRGARQGFTETLVTNIALIRRELASRDLKVEYRSVGTRAPKTVALVYVAGVTNPSLVKTASDRLSAIEIDRVITNYELQVLIQDQRYTPFPLLRATERPDFVAREIMDGKLAILLDGDPFALLVPATLSDFYRTSEDYLQTFWQASLIRLFRLASNILALFLAPAYVALVDFHPELLPTELAISFAASREGVPFPAITELILMLLAFEIIREATLRLPGMLGPTIGIVGGLVLGQAGVQAKLISNIVVIIIALTAITSFATPSSEISATWRVFLTGMMLAAATLGLYGIVLFALFVTAHLTSLTSFGTPYASPLAPGVPRGQLDNSIRAPFRWARTRQMTSRPIDVHRWRDMEQSEAPAEQTDRRERGGG